MSDRPLIDESLALLNFFNLITSDANSWGKLKKRILTIFITIAYIDLLVCTIIDWNAPDSVENVLASLAYFQLLLKLAAYKSRHLLTTLEKMEKFCSLHKRDLKQGTVNGEFFSKIKSTLKVFFIFSILVLTSYLIRPLFMTAKKQLPYASFVFKATQSPLFEIGYMCEVVVAWLLFPIQIGFDILYISMITNIVYEFNLLKRRIAQIPITDKPGSDEQALEVLGNIINHHNVILNCTRALRRAFYIPFLCIFVFNMIGIGFCLLCIIANGLHQNVGVSFVYGFFAFFYIVQLFLYCAPGTILIHESTEVSDVIFNTDWWIKTQPELRKTYVRILQRANKPVLLSAGGMMNVTLESFTAIVKSTLSFFTCVQAMYRKNI